MKLAVLSLSAQGAQVGARLVAALPDAELYVHESAAGSGGAARFATLAAITAELFPTRRGLVYIAPAGAVVRTIAPHLRHKLEDPAVVVVDVGARFAISLLSGHEGGANELAIEVANVLGAEPVVTTTTDAAKDLIVGVGCRRGTSAAAILAAVHEALAAVPPGPREALDRVRLLASADVKRGEAGLFAAGRALGVPVRLVASMDIRDARRSFAHSEVAQRNVNLPAVAEPAALLAGRRTQLLVPRRIVQGVTVAIAKEDLPWSESAPGAPSTERGEPNGPLPRAPSS